MATNYVKFLRGTPSAYAALETKDNDTLYFISAADQEVGKLYLGNILVAGNVTEDGSSIIDSLGELIDVNLTGMATGKVLGYNGTEWVPMTLDSAVSGSVMAGATAEEAGTSGFVPAPQAGDQNKFLRGDGTWAEIEGGSIDTSSFATKTELSETNDKVTANANAITELNNNNETFVESITWGTLGI